MRFRDIAMIGTVWADGARVFDRVFSVPSYSVPVIIAGCFSTLILIYIGGRAFDYLCAWRQVT